VGLTYWLDYPIHGFNELAIKPDMFFLVSDILIFLIVFLFHSYSILDWLRNGILSLFFSTFYRVITISNKYFFRIDAQF